MKLEAFLGPCESPKGGVQSSIKTSVWGRLGGSVKPPTSAGSRCHGRFMSLSPTSGSLLSAQSLLWILCLSLSLSLSLCPSLTHALSKINKHFLKILLHMLIPL